MTKFSIESTQKGIDNFEKIKKALSGLYTIQNIMASEENDVFIKLSIDNIEMLYQNFLELIFNDYGLRQLMKKIRHSEIGLEIPLEINTLLTEKNIQSDCRKRRSSE